MRRVGLILLLFLLETTLAGTQAADLDLQGGLRLLEEGRTTLAEQSLSEARGYFAKLTRKSPSNSVYFYELSRIDFYRCNAADVRADKEGALSALDRAVEEVQQSLRLDEHSADAHSLLADLYGRRIGLGGFMVGARYGPKVAAENKRALELDGNNPRVNASLGRQYLEAPKMFGGDVDRAIASFQKSVHLDPANDETLVWLALAYRKKGDTGNASTALDEALRLNPRNRFAQNLKAGK